MTDPVAPITIETTSTGIAIAGEIDAHTAPRVAEALAAAARRSNDVLVEMAGVEFVDSSGLRVLIEAQHAAIARDGALTLLHPSDAVVRLLSISGVEDFLHVRAD